MRFRGTEDGKNWTEWFPVFKSGDVAVLPVLAKHVQYNVTMAGYEGARPFLKDISLHALPESARPSGQEQQATEGFKMEMLAKRRADRSTSRDVGAMDHQTYDTLAYATREGLCGGTTANGHEISCSTDEFFVALPSWTALCSNDTDPCSYEVKLYYGENEALYVPVWDVGPYNEYDNYWVASGRNYYCANPNTHGTLPRGYGETWKAYSDGYYYGLTTSHKKNGQITCRQSSTNPGTQVAPPLPAEIDLSEGVWAQLGLTDNDYVTVEFLWVPSQ